jgi:hypothetical protein
MSTVVPGVATADAAAMVEYAVSVPDPQFLVDGLYFVHGPDETCGSTYTVGPAATTELGRSPIIQATVKTTPLRKITRRNFIASSSINLTGSDIRWCRLMYFGIRLITARQYTAVT